MNASILVIDDSLLALQVIRDTLETSTLFRTIHEASSGAEGYALLTTHPVDVVLCDLEMPGMNGFGLLELMSRHEELCEIPVIMLTGHESQTEKIRGLERGASDYVIKPFHPGELLARIKVQLKIKSLQDSLRESNRQLERLSMTDYLTGLANRRFFMETLQREFERSRRTENPLSLILLDIDHFKKVNDTCGHSGGDVVLTAVAQLLLQHMRPYDLAARYGGEEFAVILAETGPEEARQIAERLREALEKHPVPWKGDAVFVTASFGFAVTSATESDSVDELIQAADAALYCAKRNGRNRVES